jgi:ABC-type multidrug transport system fused ATPase/permease subunit
MLAFGLLDLFFSMLWFFLFVIWIIIVIRVFNDIFRSDDLGGFVKVLWMLFVIFLPLVGVFVYIISRGKGMSERDERTLQAREAKFNAYIQETAGSTKSMVDELAKLVELRDSGAITTEEYETAKSKLLA